MTGIREQLVDYATKTESWKEFVKRTVRDVEERILKGSKDNRP
jgi:hypothetical protein